MKQSKALKAISYIILPIIIGLLIISILSLVFSTYASEKSYFSSERFATEYINATSNMLSDLIYNESSYTSLQSNNMEIHYIKSYNYNFNAKDRYFLAIYQNKALTNVRYTSETSTIEEIKNYIYQNKNAKTVEIIEGVMKTNSETLKEYGIEGLRGTMSFYPIRVLETEILGGIGYITTSIEDFTIYSSYLEEFEDTTVSQALSKVFIPEDEAYIIIPISTVLIILICTYLIISIGYKKGEDGITLNDIDKIPLEIIVIVSAFLCAIPLIALHSFHEQYEIIVSLLTTEYLVIYVLGAIIMHTFIKRIKSKTLLKTTLIGMLVNIVDKFIKLLTNGVKKIFETVVFSTNITVKVLLETLCIIFIATAIAILFRFSFFSIILEIILLTVVIYMRIKFIVDFEMIEKKLKEMYEGNNQTKLNEEKFLVEYRNSIRYLNNISNGFEVAMQDRIKSERLKADLITNVSHDIKTPLTSIINYVDLLKQENIENEKAIEYIGILDNKSQRLKKLTEDLVEASKVSTGNISLNLEKINIVELINQALGEFKDKFEKSSLTTIVDSKENEINIKADSRYMYRIIENLFSNISKYALENSRVYIDIRKEDNKVVIDIKNISKDRLNISAEELMQRFVRGDKSRTTEGSGLGISIAQNLTELQNGEFNLKLDGDLFKVELKFDILYEEK